MSSNLVTPLDKPANNLDPSCQKEKTRNYLGTTSSTNLVELHISASVELQWGRKDEWGYLLHKLPREAHTVRNEVSPEAKPCKNSKAPR